MFTFHESRKFCPLKYKPLLSNGLISYAKKGKVIIITIMIIIIKMIIIIIIK